MSDEVVAIVEDPPSPGIEDVMQRGVVAELAAVPVAVQGTVNVVNLPNRGASPQLERLSTTPIQVLSADPRRAIARLVCDVAWQYRTKKNGSAVPIPARVILPITHADEVWASVSSGTEVELSVIPEFFAQ